MFASLFFLAQGAQLCICSHWLVHNVVYVSMYEKYVVGQKDFFCSIQLTGKLL